MCGFHQTCIIWSFPFWPKKFFFNIWTFMPKMAYSLTHNFSNDFQKCIWIFFDTKRLASLTQCCQLWDFLEWFSNIMYYIDFQSYKTCSALIIIVAFAKLLLSSFIFALGLDLQLQNNKYRVPQQVFNKWSFLKIYNLDGQRWMMNFWFDALIFLCSNWKCREGQF